VVLKEGITERALCAMIDGLELYGIGSSWGGFESLIVPFDPRETRTATQCRTRGRASGSTQAWRTRKTWSRISRRDSNGCA